MPRRSAPDSPRLAGVLFVLPPHFSLLSFTAAADALVTATLVDGPTRYRVVTLAADAGTDTTVASDIGIALAATHSFVSPAHELLDGIDHLFVCGGYRCSLEEDPRLSHLLSAADAAGIALGGLWNGVAALAHAHLLDDHECAVHPHDRGALAARFPELRIRRRPLVVDRGRLSAAGPASALELVLALIGRHDGASTARAVRAILAADAGRGGDGGAAFSEDDERSLPAALATTLELMRNNLDEPLSRSELARHAGLSVRTLERLFHERLDASPARHYLELRLARAAELLADEHRAVAEVARATGFGATSGFSRAFARRFGRSPRAWRRPSNGVAVQSSEVR